MSQKEPWHLAVKDDHFDIRVLFNRCDDLIQLRNGFRTEDVERRVVKRDSPVRRRSPRKTYFSSIGCRVILAHFSCSFLFRSGLAAVSASRSSFTMLLCVVAQRKET